MKKEAVQFIVNKPFNVSILSIKKYPIHWHEDVTEILLPLKGSIEVNANFEHILVKEGDFWFVNNKSIHSIRSSSKAIVAVFHIDLNYFEKYFKYIKYMFFRNNMYSQGNTRIESDNYDDDIRKGYKTRFRNLLVSVLTDITSQDPLAEELTRDSMYQLVASMVQEFNWLQFLKKSNDFISPLQLDRYHRIVKYIDEHYHEKITLDDIAKQEFITKNYFSHLWKNLSHFSFNERLNYERTLKSEFLLLSTNMSIATIAEKCGFSDVKYYYKHFRRWYGVKPLEHKKRCQDYMDSQFDYEELDLSSMANIIKSYIKEIVIPDYSQDNIWKTSYLFDNFVKMKYLYKFDKITPQPPPRSVIVNVLNPSNFKNKEGKFYFNWQNIDLLVNFSETSDFKINIKLDCQFLDDFSYKDIIHTFLDSCIYRYRIVTIEKWNFVINYQDEKSFNVAIGIGNIIHDKIQNANIRYYFEI
ncbi:AraC family transcriptional regulator [Tepidimicrobium xylanilyticum]|uniref:AraC family transcriptional regulator n=1 Tax=Tepidimicrobium xylanilyticum TaxID=1123352 RepID=UPI0026560082|nr:AraC family transcriptional regulator [Tepidimicrobium xylanilyticum]GMG95245.1 AraC family transcriptional regulator [Tepidimicrobium xylanilyticum]